MKNIISRLSEEANFRAEGWVYNSHVNFEDYTLEDIKEHFLEVSNDEVSDGGDPVMLRDPHEIRGGVRGKVYTISYPAYYFHRISKFFKKMFRGKNRDLLRYPHLKPTNPNSNKHTYPQN